eukprot:scaffold941_cov37-Tisochrysis_lutea.AAC.4
MDPLSGVHITHATSTHAITCSVQWSKSFSLRSSYLVADPGLTLSHTHTLRRLASFGRLWFVNS